MKIKEIVEQFGSPLYIFHEKEFRDNLLKLSKAMNSVYPYYIPAYSYKTNYTPYICNIVKEMGGYAEVVSDMEYYLAKKLGYQDKNIIYNGPCKGVLADKLLLLGGISNIDNVEEAFRVVELAKINSQNTLKVGIRVNSDIGAGYISRFGVELGSKSFDVIVEALKKCNNIKLSGLHCHISRARDSEAWQRRIDNLLYAADKYFDTTPDFVNVGSGMFAEMDDFLAEQFNFHIPTYEEYAEIVGGTMARHYQNSEKKPILFSEPGTTAVARYVSLVTTVNNVKSIGKKSFATVDSSYYNTGEICLMKDLPYILVRKKEELTTDLLDKVDIVGFTCLEQDCIYRDFPEKLNVGDIIMFGNVGGYSIVSKPPFIHPNCRVLSHTPQNNFIEIKRAETNEDIFQTFTF